MVNFITRLPSGISKLKEGGDIEMETRENFANHFKSIIWDELKFEIEEILKVIYHNWDEVKILRQIKLNLEKRELR